MASNEQLTLLNESSEADNNPVVCLGKTFKNDDERREYFRNELRKKLPELKKIEGFPIGEDEDIIALSDPPYYTICPNPWINDFIEEWEKNKGEDDQVSQVEAYTADVTELRSHPIYNAHSYHTKVPHRAIMKYILHYTNPGDIVFDGFSGTGMTGVAAEFCDNKEEIKALGYEIDTNGDILINQDEESVVFSKVGRRNTLLSDLSPMASFIAYNYNKPSNIESFFNEAKEVINRIEESEGWLYQTFNKDINTFSEDELVSLNNKNNLINFIKKNKEDFSKVNYIIWSDIFNCPNCSEEMDYWKTAIDEHSLSLKNKMYCSHCGIEVDKSSLERSWETVYDNHIKSSIKKIKRIPVLINYSVGKKRFEKKPDKLDELIIQFSDLENKSENWVPIDEIPIGDKTKEAIRMGLTNTHHFYTARNLNILSQLWSESHNNSLMKLSITSILVKTASLLHNVGLKKGKLNLAGALPNAFYIPSILAERNIFELLRGKIDDIYKSGLEQIRKHNVVSCMSCTEFKKLNIKEASVDYVFLDPPFGANLMYSELNFIWESWLGIKTNNEKEAIENKTQKKGLDEYHSLMSEAFKSAFWLLKPGKWMTVEFSNTKANVWNVIQSSIQEAGFVIASVSALNKGQGTFNSQTNPTSVKQDLVINAYKPTDKLLLSIEGNNKDEGFFWLFIEEYLRKLPTFNGVKGIAHLITERTPRILFDRMIAYNVQNNLSVPMSSSEFQRELIRRYPMRDGMVFLESQVAEYDKKRILVKEFSQMSLFVSDENSAIEWIRQQLLKKPQTRQDIHPNFMKEIQHIAKHEMLPELDDLLYQNFLRYEGEGAVPDQIVSYLHRNYKDLRGLEATDSVLIEKAMNRWYVPDPNKQADLEKLREKALLREFDSYIEELANNKKKLKMFRTEAIRAGFKKAYSEKDFEKIVKVGGRLPESVIQEDDKLLMYYDNACIRLGL